jgi:hypothetical protein
LLKLIDALLQSFVREETTSKKMEEKKKITFDVMRIMMMLMMLRRIRKMIEKAPTWTGKIIKFACLIGGLRPSECVWWNLSGCLTLLRIRNVIVVITMVV